MEYNDTKDLIKNCFCYKPALTAREVHFKIGRIYPCQEIYKILDELESEGFIAHTIIQGTKYVRPHYKYYLVKPSTLSKVKSKLVQIFNSLTNFFKRSI